MDHPRLRAQQPAAATLASADLYDDAAANDLNERAAPTRSTFGSSNSHSHNNTVEEDDEVSIEDELDGFLVAPKARYPMQNARAPPNARTRAPAAAANKVTSSSGVGVEHRGVQRTHDARRVAGYPTEASMVGAYGIDSLLLTRTAASTTSTLDATSSHSSSSQSTSAGGDGSSPYEGSSGAHGERDVSGERQLASTDGAARAGVLPSEAVANAGAQEGVDGATASLGSNDRASAQSLSDEEERDVEFGPGSDAAHSDDNTNDDDDDDEDEEEQTHMGVPHSFVPLAALKNPHELRKLTSSSRAGPAAPSSAPPAAASASHVVPMMMASMDGELMEIIRAYYERRQRQSTEAAAENVAAVAADSEGGRDRGKEEATPATGQWTQRTQPPSPRSPVAALNNNNSNNTGAAITHQHARAAVQGRQLQGTDARRVAGLTGDASAYALPPAADLHTLPPAALVTSASRSPPDRFTPPSLGAANVQGTLLHPVQRHLTHSSSHNNNNNNNAMSNSSSYGVFDGTDPRGAFSQVGVARRPVMYSPASFSAGPGRGAGGDGHSADSAPTAASVTAAAASAVDRGASGGVAAGAAPSAGDFSRLPSFSATSFVRAYVSDVSLSIEPAVVVTLLAAALNIVIVLFLQHHVLDTRDHLGLFLIGSYLIFSSYYMVYYFLERFSSSFRRIGSQDKKFYIIGNLLKAGILVSITPFAVYHLTRIIVFDKWESNILRNLGCIYAIPDFISMIIVKRMRWSTWIHHLCVVAFNYFSILNDYQQENVCRCVVVYAAFSSFAYCVNVLLASRFLGVSVSVARVLSFVALVVYVLCCAINWVWQVYYLRRLIMNGHDHWTVYVYMGLICLVMWDDVVLNRWLLHHAKSTAFAAAQQLKQPTAVSPMSSVLSSGVASMSPASSPTAPSGAYGLGAVGGNVGAGISGGGGGGGLAGGVNVVHRREGVMPGVWTSPRSSPAVHPSNPSL